MVVLRYMCIRKKMCIGPCYELWKKGWFNCVNYWSNDDQKNKILVKREFSNKFEIRSIEKNLWCKLKLLHFFYFALKFNFVWFKFFSAVLKRQNNLENLLKHVIVFCHASLKTKFCTTFTYQTNTINNQHKSINISPTFQSHVKRNFNRFVIAGMRIN